MFWFVLRLVSELYFYSCRRFRPITYLCRKASQKIDIFPKWAYACYGTIATPFARCGHGACWERMGRTRRPPSRPQRRPVHARKRRLKAASGTQRLLTVAAPSRNFLVNRTFGGRNLLGFRRLKIYDRPRGIPDRLVVPRIGHGRLD